ISASQIANSGSTLSASGARLSWNLPAPTSAGGGNPITFVPAPWDTSEVTYFFIQFTANLVGQQLPGVASIMSSDSADTDPLDGVATIPPIQFIFHCLA